MKSPRCPICNKNHWPREPHDFGGTDKAGKVVKGPAAPPEGILAPTETTGAVLHLPGEQGLESDHKSQGEKPKGKRGRPKTVFDFKAHRREYMKRYRAGKVTGSGTDTSLGRDKYADVRKAPKPAGKAVA